MASKINPLRSHLAIRTATQRRPQTKTQASLLLALAPRRCYYQDTYNNYNNNSFDSRQQQPPPPPSSPYGGHQQQSAGTNTAEQQQPTGLKPIEPFSRRVITEEQREARKKASEERAVARLYARGLRYHMPERPGDHMQLRDRQDPVIHQITRMIMRHGKLTQAERQISYVLNYLRTQPPPKINPARPLLPGFPPPAQLALDPIAYLTAAIDSVAPIIRVRYLPGLGGGGKPLEIPEPISLRQRRRQALVWIMDIVLKKRSMGSGKRQFAQRLASEIVAVIEGRSPVWEKRQLVHKLGTTYRANLVHPAIKKKR